MVKIVDSMGNISHRKWEENIDEKPINSKVILNNKHYIVRCEKRTYGWPKRIVKILKAVAEIIWTIGIFRRSDRVKKNWEKGLKGVFCKNYLKEEGSNSSQTQKSTLNTQDSPLSDEGIKAILIKHVSLSTHVRGIQDDGSSEIALFRVIYDDLTQLASICRTLKTSEINYQQFITEFNSKHLIKIQLSEGKTRDGRQPLFINLPCISQDARLVFKENTLYLTPLAAANAIHEIIKKHFGDVFEVPSGPHDDKITRTTFCPIFLIK